MRLLRDTTRVLPPAPIGVAAPILLLVLTAVLRPATAAQNDGVVEWEGISHLVVQDLTPTCPVEGESFTVRLRAWRNDLTNVRVVWDAGGSFGEPSASVMGSEGPYSMWEATIPATTPTSQVRYYFQVQDGADLDYYSVAGASDALPGVADHFEVDFATLSHAPYGATVHPTAGVVFRVWSPGSSSVHVRGEFNGWGLADPMTAVGEDFIARVPGAGANQRYKYYFDDSIWNTDARARALDAGDNYNAITDDPTLFPWTSDGYRTPPLEEMVIYQLHVGTFAGRNDPYGSESFPSGYRDVADRAAHLSELGVNAVMLNPITEFPGDESAGYNPIIQSATERAYGIPNDFRRLVDALHAEGIAVILDVVWNHVAISDNVLWNYDGTQIYFDTPNVDTPWGAQADFDAEGVRAFYLDSTHLWLGDYRVDGFRMDATDFINIDEHALSGWTLMQELNDGVDNRWADRVMIAEQLPDDPGITQATSTGGAGFDSQYFDRFTDDLRQEIQDAAFGDPEMWKIRDALNGSGATLSGAKVTNYFELHDEAWPTNGGQRMVETIDPTAPHDDQYAKGRTKLAQGLVLLGPGVPAILMGTEWLEDTPFDTGIGNRIDWSKKTTYAGIFAYYQELIGLRTTEPNLRADAFHQVTHVNESANVIAFRRGLGEESFLVVANFSNSTLNDYRIGVPTVGDWEVLVESSDAAYMGPGALNPDPIASQDVAWDNMGQSLTLDLAPMDLLLMRRASAVVAVDPDRPRTTRTSLAPLSPNPSAGATLLRYVLPRDGQVTITLHDLRGRRVRVLEDGSQSAGEHTLRVDTRNLARGSYFVRMRSGDTALSRKLMVVD